MKNLSIILLSLGLVMSKIIAPSIYNVGAELARREHIEFMDFMWQRRTPFIIGQHTEITCAAFDEAVENYKKGISSFLAIKIPFRHGKSDMGPRYFPANFIGQFPDEEVIVTGYAYSLIRTFSRFCRQMIQDPLYQCVYPGIKLSKDQKALDEWGIEDRHGVIHWMGIGGAATGKGGSLILIDDFVKNREAAESDVIRDSVWESIIHDILTRRAPVSIVIILATPWHVDDVFGRIEKKQKEDPDFPKFKEIKLPAFDKKYKGGVLFPERFSGAWYRSQKAILGPYGFAGLMQCDPIARGGNIFQVDKIKYYDSPPDGIRWARGWDLASSEKERVSDDPDYTAGLKVGVRRIQIEGAVVPQVFVDDMIDGRWASPTRNKMIKSAAIGDGSGTTVGVESFGAYKDAYEEVKKALWGIRTVKKLHLAGDKVSKASVLEPIMAAGNFYVRRASWNERYVKQFREFPGSAHDDYVDGTVVGYECHNPTEKRVWPQFQGRHIIKLELDWSKTQHDAYGSLHYIGMWQKEDLSVWIVMALWDAYKGFLFVYDGFVCDEHHPKGVLPKLINRAQLKVFKCESIVCNSLMWEQKGYSKNTALQYKRELEKMKVRNGRIVEAMNYDEYASIAEVGQLFDINMAFVDSGAKELVLQMMSWVTINRGERTGYRPDDNDDGYCRALCLIISELRRRQQWQEVLKPKLRDYAKDHEVVSAYNRAANQFGR
jgi:predicted phage terminase large subunit-like protein